MAQRKQSTGTCNFCNRDMSKGGLTRHLRSCSARKEAIATANKRESNDPSQSIYHIVVKDSYSTDFWLHLEVNGRAKLKDLDRYLRAIWLECCGHLSMFTIGGWGGKELSNSQSVASVFKEGVVLEHIYDFGTSSHTLLEATDRRKGMPLSKHPIFLMARNHTPPTQCVDCRQPATYLCLHCLYENELGHFTCQNHFSKHEAHSDYGEPVPLVNSPRLGMCGYEGPAEPPY